MTRITLDDVMRSANWPKCEHYEKEPALATMPSDGLRAELPSYGISQWCRSCLDTVPWEIYWQNRARQEYRAGKRQS